jgi:bifunctional UDP-N-acetylglucosamine pyrophosphorylase/glucosamine-1-phosphate N-acetyltransferase
VNDVVDAALHQKMMEIYQAGKGVSYLAGYRVESYFPGGYLEVDKNNQIHGLVEKPGAGNEPSDLVNIVAHVHTDIKTLLEKIEALYASDHPSDDHYEVAMAQIMAGKPFYCVPYDGAWYPIKFPWHVLDVTRHYLDQIEGQNIHPDAFVHENTYISGEVVIEAGAKVFIGASIIGPAYIGKGAIIGNGALVRESMIGEGSIVGHTSEVARSYLGRRVSLHRAVVLDSVFEDEVNFSAGCITANLRIDHGDVSSVVKGDRMNTGRDKLGAMVGEGAFIGIQSGTMPGVKIGPGAEVGAFTNVTHDIAQGERFYSVQEARTVRAKGRVE